MPHSSAANVKLGHYREARSDSVSPYRVDRHVESFSSAQTLVPSAREGTAWGFVAVI